MKSAKKFHIFHQRHHGKSTGVIKRGSPTEDSVIAASHAEQHACVMRKAVCQPINQGSRQANPEVASDNIRILHDARDLIQTLQWQFGIGVDKPKDVPARGLRPGIHLRCPAALALDNLIAKSSRERICAIGASTIGHNNFRSWRSLA
jgi:hypothetical protein